MFKTALALALLSTGISAQATAVIGGSTLLTASYASQLETWLGEGAITLTSLYTKAAGDTSETFHAAVDGKGRTFVVMYATEGNGNSAIIGGYNKDAWASSGNYIFDYALGDGSDNFVFNLTNGVKKNQTNEYASFNNASQGPTFGGGHDIYVDSSLSSGYSYGYSYGGITMNSLVDGSRWNGYDVRFGAIEVFSISQGDRGQVPEPISLALVGAALAAAGMARRRRA